MFIPSVPEGVEGEIRKKTWTGFLIVLLKSQERSQNDTWEMNFEQGLPAPKGNSWQDCYSFQIHSRARWHITPGSFQQLLRVDIWRSGASWRGTAWAPQSTPLARPNNWYDTKNITTEEKHTGLDDIQDNLHIKSRNSLVLRKRKWKKKTTTKQTYPDSLQQRLRWIVTTPFPTSVLRQS